jgi:hypothetical protein
MGSIKELYRSDIENKTLYEQYLKEYRDKLLELSTSLLTYYDELINSINIGYQKEKPQPALITTTKCMLW